MNPYAELDVAPDADEKAIRRAYRRRAKATHPDHGGDPAKFQQAKRASLVLLDPTRRAKYDATGEIEDDAPDNALADVLVAVSSLLDAAMVQIAQNGQDPSGVDLIQKMSALALQAKGNIEQTRREIEKHLALSLRLEKRFLALKEGAPNRLAMLVANRIAAQRANLDMLTREKAKLDRTIAFLAEYRFERDPAAQQPGQPMMAMRLGAFGGF